MPHRTSPLFDRTAVMARIQAAQAAARDGTQAPEALNTNTRAGMDLTVSPFVRFARFFNGMIDAMRPEKKKFEMTVEKTAKPVEPSVQAESALQAPSVETAKSEVPSVEVPKIVAPPYDASELDGPAYQRFLKKNLAAIKAHHSEHLAGFPKDMAEHYNAIVEGHFETAYAGARQSGDTVARSLTWANKMSNDRAGIELIDDDNPVYVRYGQAMMQCKVETLIEKNSVSITYTRTAQDPVEQPAKPAKPPKPAKQKKQAKEPGRSISSLLFSREKTSVRSLVNRLTGHNHASVDLTKMDDAVPKGGNANDGVLLHTYTRISRD